MMNRRHFTCLLIASAALPELAMAQSVPSAAAALNGQHPAAYYRKAAEMFQSGQKDAAVFVFYLGQLRYRTHLKARPDLKPDGDPALFGSLSEIVGKPVNEYAFGDLNKLDETLKAVLVYDRQNPDSFTSAAQFPSVHAQQWEGMDSMRRQIVARADDIRRQRTSNGLENRR
jgi:hypothetical protein